MASLHRTTSRIIEAKLNGIYIYIVHHNHVRHFHSTMFLLYHYTTRNSTILMVKWRIAWGGAFPVVETDRWVMLEIGGLMCVACVYTICVWHISFGGDKFSSGTRSICTWANIYMVHFRWWGCKNDTLIGKLTITKIDKWIFGCIIRSISMSVWGAIYWVEIMCFRSTDNSIIDKLVNITPLIQQSLNQTIVNCHQHQIK